MKESLTLLAALMIILTGSASHAEVQKAELAGYLLAGVALRRELKDLLLTGGQQRTPAWVTELRRQEPGREPGGPPDGAPQ